MFTGIIRYRGVLHRPSAKTLRIEWVETAPHYASGDSIAVNGVCLTAVRLFSGGFEADLLRETLRDTTLGSLEPGSQVNLEPALRAGDPLGGHFVSGHVDCVAAVLARNPRPEGTLELKLELAAAVRRYVIPKGSITVDGVSLTVQELGEQSFSVSLIPATLAATGLGELFAGAQVNLEADSLVKTVSSLLELSPQLQAGWQDPNKCKQDTDV